MKTFSVNISYFIDFHRYFGLFNIFLVTKKQMIRLVFLEIWKSKGLEGGSKLIPLPEKTTLKKPSLIRVNEPWHIYEEVFHSESFAIITYLDSWYIQNFSIFKIQDIQDTANL